MRWIKTSEKCEHENLLGKIGDKSTVTVGPLFICSNEKPHKFIRFLENNSCNPLHYVIAFLDCCKRGWRSEKNY